MPRWGEWAWAGTVTTFTQVGSQQGATGFSSRLCGPPPLQNTSYAGLSVTHSLV